MKMVKCLPEFEYFTVFLKNRNLISKIRISKVTDYAALKSKYFLSRLSNGQLNINDFVRCSCTFNVIDMNNIKICFWKQTLYFDTC